LRHNVPLIQADLKVQCGDPLRAVELAIPMPPLPTPHEGEYSLELLFEEEMLGSWRILVVSEDSTPSDKGTGDDSRNG
jgi:hypothetical protein